MGESSARQTATLVARAVHQCVERNERRARQGRVWAELCSLGGDQEKIRSHECSAAQSEHQACLGVERVYVLSHGAMPMYVGKGKIASRVRGHAKRASTKSKYWDHFSWFVINGGFQDELEVVLLRTLPFYVRS